MADLFPKPTDAPIQEVSPDDHAPGGNPKQTSDPADGNLPLRLGWKVRVQCTSNLKKRGADSLSSKGTTHGRRIRVLVAW